jgi:hypothetical protein
MTGVSENSVGARTTHLGRSPPVEVWSASGARVVVAVEGNDGRQWDQIRRFGPGRVPPPQLLDGVRPLYRARATTALPAACPRHPAGRIPGTGGAAGLFSGLSARQCDLPHGGRFGDRVRRDLPGLGKGPGLSPASWSRQAAGWAVGLLLSGKRRFGGAHPTGRPGPPRRLVPDVAMIPAQTTRDLVHRDATNEHLA